MNNTLQEVIISLNGLSDAITKSTTEQRIMSQIWWWNFPSLSRDDLSEMPMAIAKKLELLNIESIDEDYEELLKEIPERIDAFKTYTFGYLFNGNWNQSVPLYISLLQWIENSIEPLFSWESLQNNKALPSWLSRRLRSIDAELWEIIPKKEELKSQILLINSAVETAENLPADLESLKEARKRIDNISSESSEMLWKIKWYENESKDLTTKTKEHKVEAESLVEKCEESYKITTTIWLAAAFDEKAIKLSRSMWIWVAGLMITLWLWFWIWSIKYGYILKAFELNQPASYISIQIFLSILSLGAPIWFAWIATKQISQRFKLAEDYGFKASVAKAYEGYRKEATRIDKKMEERLFASALTRLEEAPLRLMEEGHYWSPWHEFFRKKESNKNQGKEIANEE